MVLVSAEPGVVSPVKAQPPSDDCRFSSCVTASAGSRFARCVQAQYREGVAQSVGAVLASGRDAVGSVDCAYEVHPAERFTVLSKSLHGRE